jgi:glutamate/tyrosine decarboxylase-like PLP-dependent enzyme
MPEAPPDPALLRQAADLAVEFLAGLAERPVGRPIDPDELRATLGGELPDDGEPPEKVLAQSWATDAHKWLNVPYDCGLIFVRDAAAHRAAMGVAAAYLPPASGQERDPFEWVPELSRRARGFTVYAAIRQLGSDGIAAMVERCCDLASRMARHLVDQPGVRILNEVVLNQVLVSFDGDDGLTRDVIRRVQQDGTAWLSGTTFHGVAAMRISVSEWSTREEDADRSVDAILRSLGEARAGRTVD